MLSPRYNRCLTAARRSTAASTVAGRRYSLTLTVQLPALFGGSAGKVSLELAVTNPPSGGHIEVAASGAQHLAHNTLHITPGEISSVPSSTPSPTALARAAGTP